MLDPGAVEFRRLTESNFHGVEVIDRPVTPVYAAVEFFRTAVVTFDVQFFDAVTEF